MAKPVKGRDGKFQGSVGEGRVAPQPPRPRTTGVFTGHPGVQPPQAPVEAAVAAYEARKAQPPSQAPAPGGRPERAAESVSGAPKDGDLLSRINDRTPLWPSRKVKESIVAGLGLDPEASAAAEKTFLSRFRRAWWQRYQNSPAGPQSESEAWKWRDESVKEAARAVEGATLIRAGDLKAGMVVRNPTKDSNAEQVVTATPLWDVRTVLRVSDGGWESGPRANAHPDAVQKGFAKVRFGNGHDTGSIVEDSMFLRFPGAERD